MNTGISRFVAISAALHLGVLAAAGYALTRPQLLPGVITVTLNETPAATAASSQGREPSTVPDTTTSAKAVKHSAHPKPVQNAAKDSSHHPSPSPKAPARDDAQIPDEAITADPHGINEIAMHTPSPPGRGWPAGQGEGKEARDTAQQTAAPQAQSLDTNTLTARLEDRLRNALGPYFTYPPLAHRNGWEGRVQVGLRVEADGRLSHVHIARSSGYRNLDSAALATLQRVNMLPEAPGWLDGRHFDMVLLIEYRLIDGQNSG